MLKLLYKNKKKII